MACVATYICLYNIWNVTEVPSKDTESTFCEDAPGHMSNLP